MQFIFHHKIVTLSALFSFQMILCVSCRSPRTGISSDSKTITETSRLEMRELEKLSLTDFTLLKTDSLRIRIVQYYRPEAGDTAARGPVKAEIELRYASETTADSTTRITENTRETAETAENTQTEQHEQVSIRGSPWYTSWTAKIITFVIAVLVLYFVVRKFFR